MEDNFAMIRFRWPALSIFLVAACGSNPPATTGVGADAAGSGDGGSDADIDGGAGSDAGGADGGYGEGGYGEGGSSDGGSSDVDASDGQHVDGGTDAGSATLRRILWIGDSITHGNYEPVVSYNNANVIDELGTHYGGIPGIFTKFASEAGLKFETHVCLISATPLITLASRCANFINEPNWEAVVLQEYTTIPLPGGPPSQFCSSVKAIEASVHAASPSANVYLYENWPITPSIATLQGDEYHNIFYSADATDGHVAGVDAAGDAWMRAWAEGVANPACTPATLPMLWYGSGDCKHPSIYGAYLSSLVHFEKITGVDPRSLGASEAAAQTLGISSAVAVQLQKVAWETVAQESAAPLGGSQAANACP
jgi:hypothetical protein